MIFLQIYIDFRTYSRFKQNTEKEKGTWALKGPGAARTRASERPQARVARARPRWRGAAQAHSGGAG
jgi:hypothetical protein